MASRVNTKFVVTLLVVLVGIVGLVGAAAVFLFKHSAAEHIAAGDSRFSEGNFKEASQRYAKGVNKEPTNVEYVRKWQKALGNYSPDNRVAFEEGYRSYLITHRQIATLLKTDVPAHREFFDLFLANELAFGGNQRAGFEALVQQVTQALQVYGESPDKKAQGEVLRRYRGIAGLRVLALTTDVKPEQIEQVREDLEAALKADPDDSRSAEALSQYYDFLAIRAARDLKQEESSSLRKKAIEVTDAFLATHPNDPRLLLSKLYLEGRTLEEGLDQVRDRVEAIKILKERREPLKARLDQIVQGLAATDPAQIDYETVDRLQLLESILDSQSHLARTEGVATRVLEKRPDDVEFLVLSAGILAERRDFTGAIAQLKKIMDLPPRAIGLAGSKTYARKTEAGFLRCAYAIREWDALTDSAEKKAALDRAKAFREELAGTVDANNAGLAFVTAQLAFAEGDFTTADQLLREYNNQRNEADIDGLWLAAQVAVRINPPRTGEARRLTEKVLKVQPTNVQALLLLAEVETRLQNLGTATELYEQALRFDPTNAAIAERLGNLKAIVSLGAEKSADPVVNTLSEIKGMYDRAEKPEVITAALRKAAADTKNDKRICQSLAGHLVQTGDRAGALEVVRGVLKTDPDDVAFKAMEAALTAPNEMEGDLKVADITARSDLEKQVRRYQIYRRSGKMPEAMASLEAAAKVAPEDPGVLELQFIEALDAKDFDKATAMAERLTKMNADRVHGETYRARLQATRGELREAIITIEEITKKGTGSPEIWRLLGRMRASAGRFAEAADAFEHALQLRPEDISAINELLQSLVNDGRSDHALTRARELERYGRGDPTFTQLFLALEGAVGDKAGALEKRLRLFAIEPSNRANAISIAALQIELKQWDAARKTIDDLRKQSDDLEAATLAARWHDAQNDIPKAKAALTDFIARQDPETITVNPYLALAQYLAGRDQIDEAIAVFEKAREKQDPKRAEADKLMSDSLFAAGRLEQGIEATRRVVRADADTAQKSYLKRLVEALIRQQKYDEAQKELASLQDIANSDPAYLLLNAEIKAARNDDKGARADLDDAVARFGDNPSVFAKRAMWMMARQDQLKDAKADLDRALKLNPSSWQLLQLRATVSDRLGQSEDTIADLKEALRIAPSLDEIRDRLLGALIGLGRSDEAASIADQNIAARKNDTKVMEAVGAMFGRAGDWGRAARFYGKALETEKTPANAAGYVTSLLNQNPPNLTEAEAALRQVQDKIAGDARLSMLRARLLALRNKKSDAKQLALEALKLIEPRNGGAMLGWYAEVQKFIPEAREMLPFLDSIPKGGPHADWVAFFRGNVLFNMPDQQESGLALLKPLTSTDKPAELRLLVFRALSIGYYNLRKWAEAAEVLKQAVDQFPEDFEFNNNLAFILAKYLDRPQDALPYAEKLAQSKTRAPEALDTLGYVYYRTGKLPEARKILGEAMVLDQAPKSLLTAMTHMGHVLKALGERKDLEILLNNIDALMKQYPSAADNDNELKTEIDSLR